MNGNDAAVAAAEEDSKATQDFQSRILSNALTIRKDPPKIPKPKWHAPWELTAVVSGHLGWVRSIAFDASNDWFVTGAADNTIKIWDLAKCCAGSEGGLKLTLTGTYLSTLLVALTHSLTHHHSLTQVILVQFVV